MARHLNLRDEAATLALGGALAAGVAPGRVMHLRGDLGAGKTTLTRGLLRALGYAGRVKSPTYTLVEHYSLSSLNLYHFDFYRFKDQEEWLSSGFRDYFNAQSLCVVEWPERAGDLLAPPDLELRLEFDADTSGRRAVLLAHSEAGSSWLSHSRSP
jgi:tRNA threonylcarbamoyladenosine biosynthesis protein TsaE